MMCSVLYVEVTRDLRYARVRVSVMGDEKAQRKAIRALARSQGFIRHMLSRDMTLRYVPEIAFELDQSITHSIRVSQLLNEMKRNGHDEHRQDD
jgi:ribosome-binding factor A